LEKAAVGPGSRLKRQRTEQREQPAPGATDPVGTLPLHGQLWFFIPSLKAMVYLHRSGNARFKSALGFICGLVRSRLPATRLLRLSRIERPHYSLWEHEVESFNSFRVWLALTSQDAKDAVEVTA
jgi:hypothetical protein